MNVEAVIAAFAMGLLGAGHCLGMCGGISAALTFATDRSQFSRRLRLTLSYNVGRMASYTLMGAMVAGILSTVPSSPSFPWARLLAGTLLILLGLYLADVWRVLRWLERVGHIAWRRVQPLGQRLMPVKTSSQALFLGVLWGWLPCGLVYTALAFAGAQANAFDGGICMLAFGLGTLPAILTGGLAADGLKRLIQGLWFRRSMALLILVFGVWTIWGALQHVGHHGLHSTSAPIHSHH